MADSSRLVVVTGGGTGGHVFPGLAAAAALRARGVDVHWLGTRAGLESRLVPAAGLPISFLRVSGMRGKGLVQMLAAPFRLLGAIAQALQILRRLAPRCVLGTGGFVAGPGGLAAWLLRIPLVVHEQNAVAGTTNRLLARVASRILLGLPGPFPEHPRAQFVGNPVREAITGVPDPRVRLQGRTGRLRLLVVGGSQGAAVLNEVVPAAMAQIAADARPQIRHQCGERGLQACLANYAAAGVEARIEAFVDDMADAYGWADIVLCRAGALTISELAAAGVPSILVPLPGAIDDHQSANARYLCDGGAALVVAQSAFTAPWLAAEIQRLAGDRESLSAMAGCARSLARPAAADVVASTCLEVAR